MLDQRKREVYRYSNRLAEKLSLRYGLASLLRQSPELGFLLGVATLGFVGEQGHTIDVGGTAKGVLILAAAAASLRQLGQSFDLWLSYAEARRRLTTALGNAGPRATPWQDPGPLGVSCQGVRLTASCRKSQLRNRPPGAYRVSRECSREQAPARNCRPQFARSRSRYGHHAFERSTYGETHQPCSVAGDSGSASSTRHDPLESYRSLSQRG